MQKVIRFIKKNKDKILFFSILFAVITLFCGVAIADVGNNNRYTGGGSDGGGGDEGLGELIAFLLGLCIDHPLLALILLVAFLIYYFVQKRKNNAVPGTVDWTSQNRAVERQADAEAASMSDMSNSVAAQIQEIDPAFSADKFTAWVREVFMKIQEAWTAREWKTIRPFESEELFSQHNAQLNEYIRGNKINVVEKIAIKRCALKEFRQDGDKEVLIVQLFAIMRDYVIDATTRQVLESDPGRDWYMRYEMVFNRKAGVKTHVGTSNKSTTNCPNCGAPTDITSAGQCEYCGSVITTGEHDWVLTDIHAINNQ